VLGEHVQISLEFTIGRDGINSGRCDPGARCSSVRPGAIRQACIHRHRRKFYQWHAWL